MEGPPGPLQPAPVRPGQRQLRVPGPAGRGLRIPDQVLRRQRRQEGRRVLHARRGGPAARPAHQARGGKHDLRPDGRLRRLPDPVPSVRRGAGPGPERPGPLRPGFQRHGLVDLQHEHDPPQHHPLHHRERRHPGGPADPGKRPGAQVRPGPGQSALLAELQPRHPEVPEPLPGVVPRDRQEGGPDVRAAHAGEPQSPTATWPRSCPTASSSAAARRS